MDGIGTTMRWSPFNESQKLKLLDLWGFNSVPPTRETQWGGSNDKIDLVSVLAQRRGAFRDRNGFCKLTYRLYMARRWFSILGTD